jgi:gliding motility-associated-like protein
MNDANTQYGKTTGRLILVRYFISSFLGITPRDGLAKGKSGMKRKLLLLGIAQALILSNMMQAQISNNWYFGQNAGYQFTPNPIALTTGAMNTSEGCATISDNSGQLLFYTDGGTVWNSLHQSVATGLQGDASSTQSSIITPKPGSFNEYYIITVGAWGGGGAYGSGINVYPVTVGNPITIITVDMSSSVTLIGGTDGNLVCEKITAVCKGDDSGNFWLIAHGFGSNGAVDISSNFYVWEITSTGVVQATPPSVHVQNVGASHGAVIQDGVAGYLKASQQGDKLALACVGDDDNYDDGFFELFGFNNTTGIITQLQKFPVDTAGQRPYGVEFSPDGNYFYGTLVLDGVYQFMTSPPYDINVITTGTNYLALQLALDGNIYVARHNNTYLSCITTPDGTPGWIEIGADLDTSKCSAGLPNFVQCLEVIEPGCDSILLNTGYDHAHNIVFDTSTALVTVMDPYWQVVGLPPNMGLNFPSPSFVIDDLDDYNSLNNSAAISFQPTENLGIDNAYPAPYIVFQRCFSTKQEGTLNISGSVMFDDALCMTIDGINIPINYWWECLYQNDCDNACTNTNHQRFYPSTINYSTTLLSGDHLIELRLRNLHGHLSSVKFEGTVKCNSISNNFNCDPCKNSTLAIQKFDDVNCNGLLDTGDSTLSDWTFDISTALSSVSITTDANGIAYYPIEPSPTGSITVSETSELASNPGYQFVSTSFGTVISPGVFSFELNDSVLYNIAVLNKKCSVNPCDSVDAKLTKIETGDCCYKLEILNNYLPDYFTGVSITSGNLSISSITIDPLTCPWAEISYQSPTQVILTTNYLYNGIPLDLPGLFQTIGTICFTGTGPDNIKVDFIIGNPPGHEIICSKTITIEACNVPVDIDCVEILDLKAECGAGVPRMKFKIHNYSNFTIRGLTLYSQNPDVIPDPQFVPVIPDLLPGQTSPSYFEVALIISNNATNACFFFAACDQNIMPGTQGQYPLYCCMDSILYCVDIPPCDPCGGMIIATQSDANSNNCCYDLTLLADYYDASIKFLEITGVGGAQFSYYTGWDIIQNESSHHLLIQAPGGSIPPGIYPDFVSICLYGSSAAPYTILVNIIDDQDRQCTDTLEFYCEPIPPHCASIINDSLYCAGTEIKYTFSVRNNSPFVIYHLDFRTNNGIVVHPQYLEPNPPIALGAVGGPYTIALDSIDENMEMFCIYLSAHNNIYDPMHGIYATECCTDSLSVVCLPLIDCFPCACCSFDKLQIPSGITPNGDGKNDVFFITNSEKCDFSITVYNRWGNIVYKDGHYQNNWEGENENGEKLPQGTYYILIELANGSEKGTYIDIRY